MVFVYDVKPGGRLFSLPEKRIGTEAGISPERQTHGGSPVYQCPGLSSAGEHSKTFDTEKASLSLGYHPDTDV